MTTERCEGAITRGSAELESGLALIGCDDPERIMTYYSYLRDCKAIPPQPSQHSRISLPPFIPILKTGMPLETELRPNRLYGVYLSSVLDGYGNFKYKTADNLRHGLRLPPTGRLSLFVTATDKIIERAWEFSEERELWKRIAALNFEFVTSATFSVYEDDPRSDQIYNQDRNFRSYDLLCDLGVPCIPFLFFNPNSDRDYNNIIQWLTSHRDVIRLAILAQCYRHRRAFQRVLTQTRSIVNDIGRHLEFVFVGAAKMDKVRAIMLEYPQATIVTPQPVLKGMVGERTQPGLEHLKVSVEEAANAKLIVENIDQFDHDIELEGIRNSSVQREFQLNLPLNWPGSARSV
jgi:hypothetical protein